MKRKRENKKNKSMKLPLQSPETATTAAISADNDVESANTEENSGSEEESDNIEQEEEESKPIPVKEVEKPQERIEKVVNIIRPEGVIQRPPPTAVYGRVKLKLKTAPKPPSEPQVVASSESQIQYDAPKITQVVNVVDKKDGEDVVGEKMEDSSKKSGGINIFSSKISKSPEGKESGVSGLSPEKKKMEEQEEVRLPQQESKYNKKELETSLEVIKKIMKMDAAEPFNVPVDPIELGIPDYFDVIDTPMDFGTIRSNLESGAKYMDSEDVYKDVQYIWDNCFKYNNKGDYIVDLMKRVKKNFMKYWMAAGLYTEHTKKIIGGENTALDEAATSGQGKKLKKGKGVKRHKDDCLCAICIMKRRRREREAREAQAILEAGGQAASPRIKLLNTGISEEYKQEEAVRAESPVEDTSSYMETSPDGDADAEMEDGEMRPDADVPQYNNRAELHDKSERSGDISEKSVQSDKGDTELCSVTEAKSQDESGSRNKIEAQKQLSLELEAQAAGYMQQRQEVLELEKKRQKQRMLETFRDLENPMLLGLCGTLFPNKVHTIWNGANSLVRCQRSRPKREIHEAISSFMTPRKTASQK